MDRYACISSGEQNWIGRNHDTFQQMSPRGHLCGEDDGEHGDDTSGAKLSSSIGTKREE